MTRPSETTSLIAAHDSSDIRDERDHNDANILGSSSDIFTPLARATVILAGLYIILFQFADILRFAPSMRLFELGYCRRYYFEHDPGLVDPSGDVPEHLCKLQEIQEELSSLKAWLGSVEGFVGLVLVVPYGILSEAKGGRFVAALNLLGYALSSVWILVVCYFWEVFPVDAIIFSPMLRAVGGGAPVSSAVILAIVANAAPSSKRSTVFFLMGAAELVTEMIMPLVSTAFLSKGFLYTPIFLGFVFEGLALLAIYYIPLDTGAKHTDQYQSMNAQQLDDPESPIVGSVGSKKKVGCLSSIMRSARVLKDRKIVILLGCFALVKVGRQMLEMLVQYMSKQFGWSFAQANIAFSVRATGSLILLLVVLPSTKQILQDVLHFHTDRVDFLLALMSNLCLILGSLGMGLANTVPVFFLGLVVFTFGSGFRQSLQSLMSSFVDHKDLTRLYTVIALFDGAGSIVWALLVNWGLKQGIHKGAAWIGLPFFIAAGAYMASMSGLLVIGNKRGNVD